MLRICPVSEKHVNENLSRLNASFSVICIAALILSKHPVFIFIPFVDFFLRNIFEGRINPIIWLNKRLFDYFSLPINLINAGPKIFAARIGLVLSFVSTLVFAQYWV
jgi:hypothetical protein